jgi:hypothetical protein
MQPAALRRGARDPPARHARVRQATRGRAPGPRALRGAPGGRRGKAGGTLHVDTFHVDTFHVDTFHVILQSERIQLMTAGMFHVPNPVTTQE